MTRIEKRINRLADGILYPYFMLLPGLLMSKPRVWVEAGKKEPKSWLKAE